MEKIITERMFFTFNITIKKTAIDLYRSSISNNFLKGFDMTNNQSDEVPEGFLLSYVLTYVYQGCQQRHILIALREITSIKFINISNIGDDLTMDYEIEKIGDFNESFETSVIVYNQNGLIVLTANWIMKLIHK